ncbi:hypothetical protein [Nocardia beijingensis]|uniref:hypothetical protein n=1 Tax=Nocardia beijingensis TaxID=95162 RepID=UPI0012F4A262|nr:hypothetical protein [Nocardia beijingensis]
MADEHICGGVATARRWGRVIVAPVGSRYRARINSAVAGGAVRAVDITEPWPDQRHVSKTGRQVHDYGGTPDEVMFKTGTEFFCKSKVTDPKTGRTIITLVEP